MTSGYVLASGWSLAVEGGASRESGDPLGIRVWANQVAAGLAPGLTNSTTSVQGYGLLCAGLDLFHQPSSRKHLLSVGPTESWLRWERLWVLAQASHAEKLSVKDIPHWRGYRQAVRFLGLEWADLTIPFLGQQLSTGSWGAYRRSAGRFGLIDAARGGRATSPVDSRLTVRGHRVAKAWRDRNLRGDHGWTAGKVAKILNRGWTTAEEARTVFRADRAPYTAVASRISRGLHEDHPDPGRADVAQRLTALRSIWEIHPSLTARQVWRAPAGIVSPTQRDLGHQGHVVGRLFRSVEVPYRLWLTDPSSDPPGAALWQEPWWAIAEGHSVEARELRQAGLSTPGSWDGLHEWAERLAARRGGQATQPGEAPTSFANVPAPALGLRSAAALFAQGLLGKPADKVTITTAQSRAIGADDE